MDDDLVNRQKRMNLLEKYRQLLLRAAKMKPSTIDEVDPGYAEEPETKTEFKVMFDLSKRLEKEYIPRSAERALWASMNAQSKDVMYIPHFHSFERQGMIAAVVLKVHPKKLREVIGHR